MQITKLFLLLTVTVLVAAKKRKDPKDFSDVDIYKLDEQWTEEGEVEDEDLPEHLRKAEPIDMSKIDPSDPEGMLKMSKRHKTLMMFVTVSGDPTEKETEEITSLWQSMLFNANIELTRFVVSANRVLIKINDGSYAYEIKDFLIQQERCESVTIEGKDYNGKGHPSKKKNTKKSTSGKKKQKKKKSEL